MDHHADATTTPRRRAPLAWPGLKRLARPGTAVATLAVAALALAACGSSSPSSSATTAANTGTGTGTTAASSGTTAASSGATVMSASTSSGKVLENSAGMPLYTLAAGTSCTGACAMAWPPLTVPAGSTPKAGSGVTGTLGTTMAGGATQVTYNGKALYTFLSDSAGHVTGDGVAGFSVVKVSASTTGASAPTTAAPSGGGSQY